LLRGVLGAHWEAARLLVPARVRSAARRVKVPAESDKDALKGGCAQRRMRSKEDALKGGCAQRQRSGAQAINPRGRRTNTRGARLDTAGRCAEERRRREWDHAVVRGYSQRAAQAQTTRLRGAGWGDAPEEVRERAIREEAGEPHAREPAVELARRRGVARVHSLPPRAAARHEDGARRATGRWARAGSERGGSERLDAPRGTRTWCVKRLG